MKKPKNLTEIRDAIDEIDTKIIALLKERSMYIPFVKEIKKDLEAKIAFAREGEMGHKLLKTNFGNYSNIYMQRMWRELIMATLFIEGNFNIAILKQQDVDKYIELREVALAQFSYNTKITSFNSTKSTLQAVLNNKATVAILPYEKESNWWVELYKNKEYEKIKLNLVLPFIPNINSKNKTNKIGFCCSKAKIEPTGNDISFFVVNNKNLISLKDSFIVIDKKENLSLISINGFITSKEKAFFIGASVTSLGY